MSRAAIARNQIASRNIVNAIKQGLNVVRIVNAKNAKMFHQIRIILKELIEEQAKIQRRKNVGWQKYDPHFIIVDHPDFVMIQYCTLFMFQIQLKFKGQSKQITVSKSLPTGELEKLIAQCFSIKEKVIGVTNKAGCFLELNQFNRQIPNISKDRFSLVTSKDVNQDSMSFGNKHTIQLRSIIIRLTSKIKEIINRQIQNHLLICLRLQVRRYQALSVIYNYSKIFVSLIKLQWLHAIQK